MKLLKLNAEIDSLKAENESLKSQVKELGELPCDSDQEYKAEVQKMLLENEPNIPNKQSEERSEGELDTKQELLACQNECKALRDQIQKQDNEFEQMQDELVNTQVQYNLAQDEIQKLKDQVTDLTLDLQLATQQQEDLEKANDVMAKDLRALSEDKLQLNQAVTSLQQLKDAILDECAEAKGEIARINEQIKGYGEGAEGVEEMHKKLM